MNPFEITKDPDGCGITVCVKNEFVVLTREEERRVTERITEILAENEKLQERVEWLDGECRKSMGMSHKFFEMVGEYQKENAKLRELAAEAIRLMQTNAPDCGLCKHYRECWTGEAMDYSPSGCVICNDARELGVEV